MPEKKKKKKKAEITSQWVREDKSLKILRNLGRCLLNWVYILLNIYESVKSNARGKGIGRKGIKDN